MTFLPFCVNVSLTRNLTKHLEGSAVCLQAIAAGEAAKSRNQQRRYGRKYAQRTRPGFDKTEVLARSRTNTVNRSQHVAPFARKD